MLKKVFPLCIALAVMVCVFLKPNPAYAHYCSDLHLTWKDKCAKITDEALQSKCYEKGKKAYRQCLKDHPQCAIDDCQDTSEKLTREASYCSDLHQKWRDKCEKITLNDTLRDECYEKGQKAYSQCLKEHPQCACQDRCEELQREVDHLRNQLGWLRGTLNRKEQEQMQREQQMQE